MSVQVKMLSPSGPIVADDNPLPISAQVTVTFPSVSGQIAFACLNLTTNVIVWQQTVAVPIGGGVVSTTMPKPAELVGYTVGGNALGYVFGNKQANDSSTFTLVPKPVVVGDGLPADASQQEA